MVLVRLNGGLGNQMFQYAAGRALADHLRTELLLDTRAFKHVLALDAYTRRSYALAPFKLRAELATPEDLKHWPRWVVDIGMRLRPARPLFRRWHFESAITYDAGVLALRDPVCLVGYWQSERYFSAIADDIRADFTLRAPLADDNARLLTHARASNSVGVHVRRGDFVSLNDAAQAHGVCSLDYYRHAIGLVRERCPDARFLVFSDDPQWARAELPLDSTTVFVTGNAECPEQDLALMSACTHHIIANSSFSWWAGWLGHNTEQIVVAPRPWYASPKLDARDLEVARWHYISRV
ncbi:MAG: alpha-1,2-fucosyltransferase [Betaproteobacteria bacterium]|nr:MAG: alpha-1,2-fucosyltransferase [Betaproteobacteria bacterium]